MGQDVDAGAPMTPVVDSKQKSGNGLKIATIVACVVAICGIGFGIYGMMQSPEKNNRISNLTVQIREEDGTLTTVEAPEINTTADGGTTITIASKTKTSGSPYIEDGYFYVPEWGVKYKLSDELTDYGFAVSQESMWRGSKDDRYVVSLTGIKKSDLPSIAPQAQTLDDIFSCSMIIERRYAKEEADTMRSSWITATFVDYDDSYVFALSNETGLAAHCGIDREAAKTASEIILNDILSHPEAI